MPVRYQQLLPLANFALQNVDSEAHLAALLIHSPLEAHVWVFTGAVEVINVAGLVAKLFGVTHQPWGPDALDTSS